MTQKRKIDRGSQLIASILVNAIYAMMNYPIMFVNILIAPFAILIVIVFISHGALISIAIVGGIIMSLIYSGISLQNDLSYIKNGFRFQDMIISSETGPITYIFGMAISELVSSLPALIILGVLAAIFIHTTALGWLMIIGSSLAIFFFSVSLGFLLANMSSDVMQSWASGSLLSMLLATIPPVYYPLSYLPYPYVYLAYLSPTTYVAQIAQYGAGLISLSANTLYIDWIAIIAISLVVLLIAIKKNRWREV